jgi:hypothetical protein
MNYRVVIHDVAKEDIRRNANWWAANHSASQAESWFHNAFDSIEVTGIHAGISPSGSGIR